MAESSKIAWCDSTFNPWIGCTKVGPGCDHCYAEAQDSRKRWGGTTHWGAGVPRYRTSASNWAQPIAWNKKQAKLISEYERGFNIEEPKPWRVFCASLADVFDNEVPDEWRSDLWRLIRATPNLSWLLVTKRIGNVARMWPGGDYQNVRILITVCNQEEADRDIPKLLALPCKNGISYEPALESVDWSRYVCPWNHKESRYGKAIEWLICGGESAQAGHPARPFNLEWARSTVEQCRNAGVPVFVKQVGSNPLIERATCSLERALREGGYTLKDRAGADPAEWPEDLRVMEFPS